MYECQKCKSHKMNIERCPNGKVECSECGFVLKHRGAFGGVKIEVVSDKLVTYIVRYLGVYGKGRMHTVEFKFINEFDAKEMGRLINLSGHECKIYITGSIEL